eukprot:1465972-Prymnesium_polylepis.1
MPLLHDLGVAAGRPFQRPYDAEPSETVGDVWAILCEAGRQHAARIAYEDVTYAEAARRCSAIATSLTMNERVAVLLPTSSRLLEAVFATAAARAVALMLDPAWPAFVTSGEIE